MVLSAAERKGLAVIVADRNRPRKHVERARIVLASADRGSAQRVAHSVGVSRPTVWRWQPRFAEAGIEASPDRAASVEAAHLFALPMTLLTARRWLAQQHPRARRELRSRDNAVDRFPQAGSHAANSVGQSKIARG